MDHYKLPLIAESINNYGISNDLKIIANSERIDSDVELLWHDRDFWNTLKTISSPRVINYHNKNI